MTTAHRPPPNMWSDLLAEALRPDAAEPVAIHLRPALHAVLCRHSESIAGGAVSREIPLVVDGELPAAPGYEIHRATPPARALPDPQLPVR